MVSALIYIALPVMDEMERLPALIDALKNQTFQNFKLVVCVNQPESWWNVTGKIKVCEANSDAIAYLTSLKDSRIEIIDKSSPGNGWTPKSHGIGAARKLLMDHISSTGNADDILISMDADTVFENEYLESVAENLQLNPAAFALSIPYYHRLTGNPELDRAMLRYEIYMRSYAINLWRIKSPYSFTALGSAIALPIRTYKRVGGMSPKLSGEDFYFLQKIVKTGRLLHWNREFVYPATRASNRVFFGTGPAIIRGMEGDWTSYPVYHRRLFDAIALTCKKFGLLYKRDISTPLDAFLISKFGELPWQALRSNFKTPAHFVRACHEKIDGLRILQFLKESQEPDEVTSEHALEDLLEMYKKLYPEIFRVEMAKVDFANSPLTQLDTIRNILFEIESDYRKIHWNNFTGLTSLYN